MVSLLLGGSKLSNFFRLTYVMTPNIAVMSVTSNAATARVTPTRMSILFSVYKIVVSNEDTRWEL